MKKKTIAILLTLVILLSGICGFTIAKILDNNTYALLGDGFLTQMTQVMNLVEGKYYQDVDPETLKEGALRGMVDILGDPYSAYMSEEEYEEYTNQLEGNYAGIGVLVTLDQSDGMVTVLQVYSDTPAEQAGMQKGDKIIRIEGEEIEPFADLNATTDQIKGEADSTVNLTILRNEEQLDMQVTRKNLVVQRVQSRVLSNDIGYIEITEFGDNTARDFRNALEELQSQEIRGLIIDVRDNPGGYLDEATDIADLLLPEGIIVYTLDKQGEKMVVESNQEELELPMCILVNENSASASEILVGAIQDYQKGAVIGEKTFGKGVVQQIFPVGSGAVKVTVSSYYTPNGRSIHETGITPDIEVSLPEEVENNPVLRTDENDTQLQRAIQYINEQ